MGMKTSSTLLAGMICAVLGGCSTERSSAMNDNTYGPGYGAYSSTSSPGSGSSMGGSNASPTGAAAGGGDMSRSAAMNASGVVLTIEAIPRAQATGPIAGQSGQSGSSGTSGTSGTSGASSGSSASDVVYRITLRQDDGTTRSVNQESQPSVQIGDRVRMENGMLERY